MIVAIDDGFSYTDICWRDGKGKNGCLAMETHISAGVHTVSSMSGEMDENVPVYETEGLEYTVNSPFSRKNTLYDDHQYSREARVMAWHAMYQAKVPPGDVVVGLTLPLEVYFADVENRRRKAENFKVPVRPYPNGEVPWTIRQVHVLPESLIAATDYFYDFKGDKLERVNEDELIAVIDVGGRTTDIAVTTPTLNVNMDKSGSENIGVLVLAERIRERIKEQYKGDFQVGIILRKIAQFTADGSAAMKIYGEAVDVSDLIRSEITRFTDEVVSVTKRKLGDVFAMLDRVVIVGGGADIIKNEIRSAHQGIVVPERSHFANARGMVKYIASVSS